MSATCQVERLSENAVVVKVDGRLNAASAVSVKNVFKEQVQKGGRTILVDLSGLEFIDSSGLAALVSGYKLAREAGGVLKLAGLSEQARSVFAVTHLDRVFEIAPDVAALKAELAG
jgi:anti-sigma B factor antagonist